MQTSTSKLQFHQHTHTRRKKARVRAELHSLSSVSLHLLRLEEATNAQVVHNLLDVLQIVLEGVKPDVSQEQSQPNEAKKVSTKKNRRHCNTHVRAHNSCLPLFPLLPVDALAAKAVVLEVEKLEAIVEVGDEARYRNGPLNVTHGHAVCGQARELGGEVAQAHQVILNVNVEGTGVRGCH